MAQRRMFSLKVIDTDNFLDMSPTAQNLYFHLGMRADDDGFVASPKKIMQMCGAPDDDMKVLIAKCFIIPMATNGVCVITHWKVNNLIRPDRYVETEYKEEKGRLDCKDNKYFISTGPGVKHIGIQNVIPNGNQRVTQDRLGKDRLGKDIEKRNFSPPSLNDVKTYCLERKNNVDAENFINFYESKGWFVGKNKMKSWRAAVRTWEARDNQNGKVAGGVDVEIPNYAKGYIKQ